MKKTKILVAIFVVIIIVIPVLIYATILGSTKSNNIITFGKLKMELIETSIDKDGNEVRVSNNENEYISLNSTVSRKVKVKNVGKHSMYIRLKLNMLLNNNYAETLNNSVSYDINDQDYIFSDGWYYYKKILEPGEETTNLITKIDFSLENLDEDIKKTIRLDIDAQAVQAENQSEDVLMVKGWPEE